MTTPRVTVPVEPTEAMIDAYFDTCRRHGFLAHINATAAWRAMLSAAPAPEGGAVKRACVDFQEAIDDFEADVADVMAEGSERADLWDREIMVNIDALKTVMNAALATREEAPAEAGEVTADSLRSVSDETVRALLSCKDVGSGRAHLASIINALRAQPPAREDAQPVAKVVSAHGDPEAFGEREIEVLQDLRRVPYNTPLYAHPAPDALREAVEQTPDRPWIDCVEQMLGRFDRAKGRGGYPTANEREAMRRCMIPVHLLSALQAEQKGGA